MNGTFVVNGTERVIVSQMHRSPGRVLRPRQGQDAFVRQAAVRGARHSLSRLVARFRIRRQGHRACPHRPPPQAAGDDAALCARPGSGRHPRLFLHQGAVPQRPRTAAGRRRSNPTWMRNAKPNNEWTNRQDRRGAGRSRPEDHRARPAQMAGRGHQSRSPWPTRNWSAAIPRSTWSMSRRAKSMSKPATS